MNTHHLWKSARSAKLKVVMTKLLLTASAVVEVSETDAEQLRSAGPRTIAATVAAQDSVKARVKNTKLTATLKGWRPWRHGRR